MSNQATRLAEELKWLVKEVIDEFYIGTLREHQITEAIDALLALVQPAVSEEAPGWVTVPNTATHNMLNAANAGRKKGRSSSGDIYRAMIEAAPRLSAQSSSKGDEGMQHE